MIPLRPICGLMMLLFAWCGSVRVLGQDDIEPELKKILADWEKRRQAIKVVRYELAGEAIQYVKPSLAVKDDSAREDRCVLPKTEHVLMDFVGGRHRRESSTLLYDPNTRRRYPFYQMTVSDGSSVQSILPSSRNTNDWYKPPAEAAGFDVLTIAKGNLRSHQFDVDLYPIFFNHGIVPTEEEIPFPSRLAFSPNPDSLRVHGLTVHKERRHLVLRTVGVRSVHFSCTEYWVDIERSSRISRCRVLTDQRVTTDLQSDYEPGVDDWRLSQWTVVSYRNDQELPARSVTFRVARIIEEPALSANEFTITSPDPIRKEVEIVYKGSDSLSIPVDRNIRIFEISEDGKRRQIQDERLQGVFDAEVKDEDYGKRTAFIIILAMSACCTVIGVLIWLVVGRRNSIGRGPNANEHSNKD